MIRQFTPCWPDNCLAAVSLTFDDGPPSQLKCAVPILNNADLQATFYLCPRGNDFMEKLMPWRDVAKARHEIGNHTVTHPNSRAFRNDPAIPGLEGMTLADIEKDIVESKCRLQQLVPEQKEMSFCYPCYMEHVGCGPTRQSYVPVVARHHIAGRGKGEFPFPNPPATVDLHYAWSWPAERMSGSQMIGLAEACVAKNCWGIFTFHGINEGRLSVTESDFRDLVNYLTINHARIWTVPVVKVAQRILEWRKENGL
ncbi:MAG: polysaccharide deacetylase family protein [Kiritimatiellae bacterium]|nr:polysaccharide deacetylase family protein [Kiritimatiellia bacterium]MDD5523375.1 polysaccharide deacetylase family protein [Kiritimatiellia bacterium]